MSNESNENLFPATSGEVNGVAVQVDYGPLPDPLPAISGVWVGRVSLPGDRDRCITFTLVLTQAVRQIRGTSLEASSLPEHKGTTALVADWTDGKVTPSGAVTVTKRYRDLLTIEPVCYEGQVNADMRSMGGTWRNLDGQVQGTFVMYKTCRLQGWGL